MFELSYFRHLTHKPQHLIVFSNCDQLIMMMMILHTIDLQVCDRVYTQCENITIYVQCI